MADKKKTNKKKNKKVEEVKIFFNEEETKKNKRIKFIIIPFVVIAVLVICLLLFNKMENTLTMLSKLKESTLNNVTSVNIDTEIKVEGKENKNNKFNIGLDIDDTFKFSYVYNNEYKFYLKSDEKNIDIFLTNNFLDSFGITESNKNKWLIYSITNKKLVDEINTKTNGIINDSKTKYTDIDFVRFLDEEHLYYVNKENNVNHYQLLVDKEMVKNIIHEINNNLDKDSKLSNKKISNILKEYDKYINKDIIIDIYIDMKEYLINKIVIEYNNDYLKSKDIDKITITSNIKYNDTVVKVEQEALESDYTIEKYIEKYKKED